MLHLSRYPPFDYYPTFMTSQTTSIYPASRLLLLLRLIAALIALSVRLTSFFFFFFFNYPATPEFSTLPLPDSFPISSGPSPGATASWGGEGRLTRRRS